LLKLATNQKKLREKTDSLINKWKSLALTIADKSKYFSNISQILNEIDKDLDIINSDILNDSQAKNLHKELIVLRNDLENWKQVCTTLQRFQTAMAICEDLFFNHDEDLNQ